MYTFRSCMQLPEIGRKKNASLLSYLCCHRQRNKSAQWPEYLTNDWPIHLFSNFNLPVCRWFGFLWYWLYQRQTRSTFLTQHSPQLLPKDFWSQPWRGQMKLWPRPGIVEISCVGRACQTVAQPEKTRNADLEDPRSETQREGDGFWVGAS